MRLANCRHWIARPYLQGHSLIIIIASLVKALRLQSCEAENGSTKEGYLLSISSQYVSVRGYFSLSLASANLILDSLLSVLPAREQIKNDLSQPCCFSFVLLHLIPSGLSVTALVSVLYFQCSTRRFIERCFCLLDATCDYSRLCRNGRMGRSVYQEENQWLQTRAQSFVRAWSTDGWALKSSPSLQKLMFFISSGSTPLGTYRKLIEFVKANELSFKYVVTFNMDEYVGLARVRRSLFLTLSTLIRVETFRIIRKVIIPSCGIISSNTSISIRRMCTFSTGMLQIWLKNVINSNGRSRKPVALNCSSVASDPMDTSLSTNLVTNLPRTSPITANGSPCSSPSGSSLVSRTRVKTLAQDTIVANARFFDNDVTKVPHSALTVGVGTVMEAREVSDRRSMAIEKSVKSTWFDWLIARSNS